MADIQGLFGLSSPQQLQQNYLNANSITPAQMGNQTLLQQVASSGANAGAGIGSGLGRLFGGTVPGEEEAIAVQNAFSQVSQMDLPNQQEKMNTLANLLEQNPLTQQYSIQARQESLKAAKAGEELLSIENKEKARIAVASLGPNASIEDINAALRPYLSTSSIYAAAQKTEESKLAKEERARLQLEKSNDKREALRLTLQSKTDDLQIRGEQALEKLREQNASKENINNQIMANQRVQAYNEQQNKLLIATNNNENKRLIANSKTDILAPSLQAGEDKDLQNIDKLTALSDVLKEPINSLTPELTSNKSKLELGLANIKIYQAKNYLGKSTPESRAYATLDAAVKTAVNIQVSAQAGVATDKDVIRFAEALIGAFARNDTKGSLQALISYDKAVKKAIEKTQNIIQSRRKSQKVEKYNFGNASVEGTTIEWDSLPSSRQQ